MRKMMAISVASTLLGYAVVYFVFFAKPAPVSTPEKSDVATEPTGAVVLAQVVDVTDLDTLLDPPPVPPSGEPFEPLEPLELVTPVTAPAPIPLAAD